MPPPNAERRAQLADAGLTLLARKGVHGVTHRAVDMEAGLPSGTASNYFRNREALLVAAADRVVELHLADMRAADQPRAEGDSITRLITLIDGSLQVAATLHRERYIAIFELRLESLRRPALADALRRLVNDSTIFTTQHHHHANIDMPPETIPLLLAAYGGALFTLVTAPAGTVDSTLTRALATAVVKGSLGGSVPPGSLA